MKVHKLIEQVADRWIAQIGLYTGGENVLTAREEEAIAQNGQPLVDVGGSFSGSLSRTGVINPTILITGDGADAAATAVISEDGELVDVLITNAGSGYNTITLTLVIPAGQSGNLPTMTGNLVGNALDSVTIDDPGSEIEGAPVSVAFTLPSEQRRLVNDFPVRKVFDEADYFSADLRALLWANTVRDRMVAARDSILEDDNVTAGETVETV